MDTTLTPLFFIPHAVCVCTEAFRLDKSDLLAGIPLCCPSGAPADLPFLSRLWAPVAGCDITLVGMGWTEVTFLWQI